MAGGSSSSSSSSSSSNSSPCAACKFLRRKCMPECVFAAYFPAEEPQKFANVHKIFGASNVSKLLLNDVLPHQREDAVNSLAYEAEARVKDPVYGCVAAISLLQRQVLQLQKELDNTNAHLIRYANNNNNNNFHHVNHRQFVTRTNNNNNNNSQFGIGDHGGNFGGHTHNSAGGGFYIGSSPWNGHDHDHGDHHRGGGNN